MDEDLVRRLKSVLAELSPELDAQNEVPKTLMSGIGDGAAAAQQRFLTSDDQREMRGTLRKLSNSDLMAAFGQQARKKNQGIDVDTWMSAGGNANAIATAMNSDPMIQRALDSGGAAALIRQDLEPILYELYIRQFPAWERFRKEPSNGLVHAWNQQTGMGDAKFMAELGTVTDDQATYVRQTSPIAILATRRGVSIKGQWGTLAGGAGFNPEQLELQAGLRAIAHKMQKTIFQGNSTISSAASDGSDEDGAYDQLGFTGLRQLLKASTLTVDPTLATPEDMRAAIDVGTINVMQNAGHTSVIYLEPQAKGQFDTQQDKNVRYLDTRQEAAVGVLANVVNTAFGPLPLFPLAGDSIGEYTKSAKTVTDMYLLDEDSMSVPYLGSDGPTVLDIPMGVSGQLTRIFIIFGMWGFALKAPNFNTKVRVIRP
jgi:hypothetical protein